MKGIGSYSNVVELDRAYVAGRISFEDAMLTLPAVSWSGPGLGRYQEKFYLWEDFATRVLKKIRELGWIHHGGEERDFNRGDEFYTTFLRVVPFESPLRDYYIAAWDDHPGERGQWPRYAIGVDVYFEDGEGFGEGTWQTSFSVDEAVRAFENPITLAERRIEERDDDEDI